MTISVTSEKGTEMSESQPRIGSACWYRKEADKYPREMGPWQGGKLLFWSTDHQEYESGPGPFPVGVVEDDETHAVESIYAGNITFASVPDSA